MVPHNQEGRVLSLLFPICFMANLDSIKLSERLLLFCATALPSVNLPWNNPEDQGLITLSHSALM